MKFIFSNGLSNVTSFCLKQIKTVFQKQSRFFEFFNKNSSSHLWNNTDLKLSFITEENKSRIFKVMPQASKNTWSCFRQKHKEFWSVRSKEKFLTSLFHFKLSLTVQYLRHWVTVSELKLQIKTGKKIWCL